MKDILAALADEETSEGESPDDGMGEAKTRAAEDLMSAVESKDASAFADAFQRMYDACSTGSYESDEE